LNQDSKRGNCRCHLVPCRSGCRRITCTAVAGFHRFRYTPRDASLASGRRGNLCRSPSRGVNFRGYEVRPLPDRTSPRRGPNKATPCTAGLRLRRGGGMTAPLTADQFLELARKSGLLDPVHLEAYRNSGQGVCGAVGVVFGAQDLPELVEEFHGTSP